MTLSELMQNPHETIAGASRSQIRPPTVTTESDKVEIAATAEASQRVADNFHDRKDVKIRTLNPRRVRHPHISSCHSSV
jgi:hypothetical protein